MSTIGTSRQASLNSIVDDSVKSALRDLHTCTPGIVDKFDPVTGRAEIQPTIQRIIRPGTTEELVTLPKLINCPIGVLKSGGFVITMPVKAGDECIIHFTERSLDAWIKFGDVRGPNDRRMHHVGDAYFLPCTTSEPNATVDYDSDNMVLRNTDNTLKMTFTIGGDLVVEAVSKVTIQAPDVVIDGALQVTGTSQFDDNIDVTGTSTATEDHISGTISGKLHTHTSAAPGSPTSPPTP